MMEIVSEGFDGALLLAKNFSVAATTSDSRPGDTFNIRGRITDPANLTSLILYAVLKAGYKLL